MMLPESTGTLKVGGATTCLGSDLSASINTGGTEGGDEESGMMPRLTAWIRVALAAALALILLEAANRAARDCSTGPDASENCLWLDVRRHFGLPSSRLLRAGVLEAAGLAILAGLYFTFRYIWPAPGRRTVKG